jgi:phosphohistidine phosphatase
MGRFLREAGLVPGLVLSSDSRRTRQTIELALPEMGGRPQVKYLRELYLAEPEVIFSAVRRAPDAADTLLIVGHNPGVEQAAIALAAVPLERKLRKRYDAMDEKFPTCAVAAIGFDVPKWRDVMPGIGELDAFVRPKDLEDGA